MAQDVSFWIDLFVLVLLVGVSVRLWFQNILLHKINYYLFEVNEHEQQEIAEFMEGFADAIITFQREDSLESNAQEIAEWDAS